MKLSQVAVQLYTLRDFTKTIEDFTETCRKVKEIGYQAIQVSAIGPISDEDVRRIAADHGLAICATHESGKSIFEDATAVAKKLERLGTKYTAYPFPHLPLTTTAELKDLAAKLDEAGKVLRDHGKVLTYHNHHIEFMKIDGVRILDYFIDNCDPVNLQYELDTYWVQYGGGNNVEYAQALKGRLPLLHLKDFQITPERQIAFSEIGAGNLNFKTIIAAAEASGCEWFIVEQDSCPGNPFDSVKQSFDYIKANLVEA
jgi:sugar phosphate isomerase/epimerase